jgi:hypothetical protein
VDKKLSQCAGMRAKKVDANHNAGVVLFLQPFARHDDALMARPLLSAGSTAGQ